MSTSDFSYTKYLYGARSPQEADVDGVSMHYLAKVREEFRVQCRQERRPGVFSKLVMLPNGRVVDLYCKVTKDGELENE